MFSDFHKYSVRFVIFNIQEHTGCEGCLPPQIQTNHIHRKIYTKPVYLKGRGSLSRMHWYCCTMDGVFIPSEFYKVKNLNGLERDVLALYKYYTEKGSNKCCSLNSVQIAEVFNVSSRYIKRVRKHLSDLGYIRTDGGIKVTYIGLQVGSTVPTQGEPEFTPKGTTVHPRVNHSSPQKGTTVPLKGEPQFTHKEEKKEKEEEKKKKEGMKTNFEWLLELLPEDCKTQEKIDHIKKEYEDRINSIVNMGSDGMDTWVMNIKLELTDYKTPIKKEDKKEEVSDTIDVL